MLAAVMRSSAIVVDRVPDPVPAAGEVLVRTLVCGICGSDLHALRHADKLVQAAADSGAPKVMDPSRDVVMGHEFCAEIVDFGPQTRRKLKTGTRVVSMPLLVRASLPETVGYSNDVPGGYGEAMVLSEAFCLEVPAGLESQHAALTEPMAVGLHAVAKAAMQPADGAVVIGCGPVGLAVIAALRLARVEPILAADFSPLRRDLARHMGAHEVVDPSERPAIDAYRELAALRPAVLFECVGAPGVIEQLVVDAPRAARIVVAGVCMEVDRWRPMVAINKELCLQFVLGYTPDEFSSALRSLAEGQIDVTPLITGRVSLEGVAKAFDELATPDAHAKILVEPNG